MSPRRRVRPLAVAAVRRDDGAVLVQRGTDGSGRSFHRLVGGGIDFGESAAEAVVREFDEELGGRLRDVVLLGWLENRFVLDGEPGHEIVAVHAGRLTQRRLLERDDLGAIPGTSSTVHWVPEDELFHGPRALYPDGASALLRAWLDGLDAPDGAIVGEGPRT